MYLVVLHKSLDNSQHELTHRTFVLQINWKCEVTKIKFKVNLSLSLPHTHAHTLALHIHTQTHTHRLTTFHHWHDDNLLLCVGETQVKGGAHQSGRNSLQKKLDDFLAVCVHKVITLPRKITLTINFSYSMKDALTTVESLYSGHPWESLIVLIKGGVLISGGIEGLHCMVVMVQVHVQVNPLDA